MSDTTYLEDHPPARSQYRTTRRAAVTGAIVIHTAENATDTDLPDGGAEAVARFISRRTDGPGSYHSVVDSDSIVRVGRYEWEMFHEGTGGNRWSLGLSFACRADQWPGLSSTDHVIRPAWTDRGGTEHPATTWAEAAIANGVKEAAQMAKWVRATVGVDVPARRITAAQYRAGRPGFISHAELDPGRRTDPGAHFPWTLFLNQFANETGSPTMPLTNPYEADQNAVLDILIRRKLYDGARDGWIGPNARRAIEEMDAQLTACENAPPSRAHQVGEAFIAALNLAK